jgi:hypothetical protein
MSKYKIQCTITGLWSNINTRWMEKIIQKHGSVDAFRDKYVCRDAKRLLKEGKTAGEIRAMVDAGTLTSKVSAPKAKAPKAPKAPKVKAPKKEPHVAINEFKEPVAKAEVAENDEVADKILDPDVKAFMSL